MTFHYLFSQINTKTFSVCFTGHGIWLVHNKKWIVSTIIFRWFWKKKNSECTKLRSGVELSEGLAYLGVIENQLRGPLKPLVCVYITQTRRIIALITLPAGCAAAYYRISIKRYQLSQDHFSAQSRKRKGVEKTIFGLNKKNSTPWAPQYTIVLWWSERLQGALNWAPMMPRDASLW